MDSLSPPPGPPPGPPPPQRPPAGAGLVVRDLSKRFGQQVAVAWLSFQVGPGEIMALLGPNGAGKTTTLMCLAGLLRPDTGAIFWNGVALGPRRGRQVGLIPDSSEVYEMLTVWEHLVFVARGARLPGGWEARAHALLEEVGLLDVRDKLGEALSKGMRQRLLIAATVLASTPVLLLDEPMVGLDPAGQRQLRDILLRLRAGGVALIVSTHLLENVQSFCDRLLILKQGVKVAEGTLQEIVSAHGGKSLEETFFEIVG